jgi:serine/threonine protein kinase
MAWQGRKLSSLAQDFISQMLQHPLEPARRPTPGEVLNHEWLQLKNQLFPPTFLRNTCHDHF